MRSLSPMFATAKTAAKLMDMRPSEFEALVREGILPPPRKIGQYERWEVDALKAIASGDVFDSYEQIEW